MEQRNYMSNQSSSTDQSLNTSNQNQNYLSYNINTNSYYNPNFKKIQKNPIENPKVIINKLIPQKESVYSINDKSKKIIKNNESFDLSIKKQYIDNSSFYSQKPIQTFELNLNNINTINNNGKINNIVNIDNQSSAFELCFMAKKKQVKNNYKINVIYQIGPEQTPLSFAFYATNNKKTNDDINIQVQNASFISNKQIENNSFVENEINFINNINNIPNKKNELKIMQNPERKSENKPKPVLQIMTSDNKSNYNKKLSESNLPRVNGFNLEDNNNDILKNNFVNISKSASMIVNNNQDISFISNSKETENLLEMNALNIDNNYYNKNIINFNGYIMTNEQLIYIAEKKGNKNKNNISNISNNSLNNSLNKKSAKKYIKIEYYDTQPVYFDIISEYNSEDNIDNENNKLSSYKMYRVEEVEFINNKENEEKSVDKEENKSFNNNNNKKRKRRKKKNK